MKHPIFPILAGALLLGSCERPAEQADSTAGSEAMVAALEEARDALEAERRQLEAERQALEDTQSIDEAALADVEPVESVPVAVTADEDDPEAQREMLEAWEDELTAREKELAGQQALEAEIEPVPETYDEPVADYGLFYDSLDDHGDWFETPDYGYIFQPRVVVQDRSWRPYTRGRWVCSDRGWLWVSEEPFGWATYHYGRWVLLAGRGWCWVPGGEWAPAWVAWRHGGGHVGWAPLPPETLSVSGHGWGVSVEVDFGISEVWFTFVEERYIAAPIWRHCLPVGHYRRFWNKARPCTNLYYLRGRPMACGPSYAALRPHVRGAWPVRRIEIDPVVGIRRPGMRMPHQQGRAVRVFAPTLDARWNPAIRPSNVASRLKDIRVERAVGGVNREWRERFQDRRREREQAQQQWAGKFNQVRQKELRENRLAAVKGRNRQINERLNRWKAAQAGTPSGRDTRQERPEARPQTGRVDGVETQRNRQPDMVEPARPTRPSGPTNPAADRLRAAQQAQAEKLRQQQEKLRQANPRNRTSEPRPQDVQRQQRDRSAAEERGRPQRDPRRANQERMQNPQENARRAAQEKIRQAQEQQRRGNEQRQAQENTRRAAQEKAREAQEQQRRGSGQGQAQENARRAAQEKMREAQEQQRRGNEQRQAQENARRAAQEKAREAQEQQRRGNEQRQGQENARRAAQERAREAQEQQRRANEQRQAQENARRAAQERAREVQEQQRRANEQRQAQENARRAAQEQARRAQEQQRRASEQREQQERQQRANQERMRQQQERARQQQDQARQSGRERQRQQQERVRELQEQRNRRGR